MKTLNLSSQVQLTRSVENERRSSNVSKGYDDFEGIQAKSFQVVLSVLQPAKKQENVVAQQTCWFCASSEKLRKM
jgi:hypothetical protein